MDQRSQTKADSGLLEWGSWLYLALALAAIAWLGLRDGAIPLSLFIASSRWHMDLGIGLAAASVLVGSWRVALAILPSARRLETLVAEAVGPLRTADVIVLAVLSGFAEELFFRGAVQSQWGWVSATLLFALVHIGPAREFRLWTAFAFVAGAALGGLMVWRGTLLAPVVAHVAVNLVGLARLQRLGSLRVQEPP